MEKLKKERLEKNGWKIGSAQDFLKLSDEESEFVEVKLALSHYLQQKRRTCHLTQHQLADLIKSSQSRVAKMEHGDTTVSIDLLIRSLFALGTTKKEIASSILSPGYL
jgi:DNA-binding XRE family transcriptional regulator